MVDAPEKALGQAAADKALGEAIGRADVPKLYANGFAVAVSNADVILLLQRFGSQPVAVVNLSYTLAKTLAQRLGAAVSEFESKIAGQDILTTDKIDEAAKKAQAAESKEAKLEEAKTDVQH